MTTPRLVIGAAHSGAGKTSVSIALARAFARRGLKVATFKVGPDFLDPTYLAIASKRKCYNLDGWMMGLDYCKKLFAEKTKGADITIVEGVMGLFDGASGKTREGSTAEITAALNAPVALVVGTHGMGGSVAPLVKGFSEFDGAVRVACVIANNAGSESHAVMLKEALEAEGQAPLAGAIPRGAFPQLPGRHLGLVTADAEILNPDILDQLADAVEKHVDLELLLKTAKSAGAFNVESAGNVDEKNTDEIRIRIGIASDEAFHFYYQDTLEALEAAGCELVEFSPIRDGVLPENLSALYFGGGYPEAHAAELAANDSMMSAVREFAESDSPLYAECGGLMYLSRYIRGLDGAKIDMCGVLPFGVRMLEKRWMLGYVEARLEKDSLWGSAGTVIRGHEFHYSEPEEINDNDGWKKIYSLKRRRSGAVEAEGFSKGAVLASYAHLHFASTPGAVRAFTDRCAARKTAIK